MNFKDLIPENIRKKECGDSYFYIYTLSEPDTENIRYVGLSKQPLIRFRQHLNDSRTNKHKSNWLKKINYKPILLIHSIECSLEDAINSEKNLIETFRKRGLKLINKTIGGEYTEKGFLSDEVKEKIRQTKIGNRNPNFGKIYTEEEKLKLSKILKGRKFSEKHLENLKKVNQRNRKEVHRYDFDGNYIDSFSSILEASSKLNIHPSKISGCCNNKRNSTGGFQWSFEKVNKIKEYVKFTKGKYKKY